MKDVPLSVKAATVNVVPSAATKDLTYSSSNEVSPSVESNGSSSDESDMEDDHFEDAIEMDDQMLATEDQDQISNLINSLKTNDTKFDTPTTPQKSELGRKPSFLGGKTFAKLSKKQIAQLKVDSTDEKILEDIIEVEKSLEMFLNSRFRDAEVSLLPKYGQSLYFTEGVGLLRTLRAVMTFDPDDMSSALDSLGYAAEVAGALRKQEKGVGLFGMISGAANIVTGTKDPNYLNGMTRVQKHAELVYAECSLNFVKEGMQLRSSFAIIRAAFKFLETIYEEEGVEGYANHFIDEHFTSGVIMNAGLFTLVLSFLPSKIIKGSQLIVPQIF
ncbi:UNVERIFIED_CONTAM: hypothetical protein HDU68_001640 [Siphonaria sp. JEL0065]|nr:hypothetical protein HDU68_001640 [Siphonaria sp. JEL0065]